ncbi:MAG: dihydropyrimidinase [Desulforhopalus sp.]
MKLFIESGTVVNADSTKKCDVLIENGVIAEVGTNLNVHDNYRKINAEGLLVLPGGIDPHTHLEMPVGDIRTADTFEGGGRAALAGGTTTVIDFVNPVRGQSFLQAFDQWLARAEKATCNYSFHVTVTWFDNSVADEMRILAGERGVNSFKHFTTYRDTIMLAPDKMLQSFELVKELGSLCTVHAENDEIITYLQQKLLRQGVTHPRGHVLSRPPIAEGEATNRVIAIAQVIDVPIYIVHLSCNDALMAVIAAQDKGQKVYAESLCGHLLLDKAVYFEEDPEIAARYVMSPPYRSRQHRDALWKGLASGAIQTIASDNCTFTQANRNRGLNNFTQIPNGSPGIEDRMRIIWDQGVRSGKLTPEQFVAATSTNAAKIFNIFPRKGLIAPGSDADIVLWSPTRQHTVTAQTHKHAIDYSVYEGITFTGSPVVTILNGEAVFEDGAVTARAGQGQYIPRPHF